MSQKKNDDVLVRIREVEGGACVLRGDDVDTDRIIPARFMKVVTFDDMGRHAFEDARKAAKGKHPLDDPRYSGAKILIVGNNFGCGSSREHAPQAIQKYGFRAVVAEGFAEIFFGNCTTLGIPCMVAKREDIARIAEAVNTNPQLEVTLDLDAREIRFGGQVVKATLRETDRDALVNGRWDAIGELLEGRAAIQSTAARLPYLAA